MFIDTHAHLTMPEFSNLDETLDNAGNNGVEAIIDVAYDFESAKASVKLSEKYDYIYSAVGIHPHDANSFNKDMIKELRELLKNPKVKAIGEAGLDYHYNIAEKDKQKTLFIQMVQFAVEYDLPLIIHGRLSYEDIIDIINKEGEGKVKGIFHSFSGTIEQANWAINNNILISFSGMLTFKKAANIVEIATAVPIEKTLIETDCPYLTPEPYRGKWNEPAYVKYVAEKLANIKGLSIEEVGKVTTQNAKTLFKI